MYGLETNEWLKLLVLLTFLLLVLVSFNVLMRKLLKVEKKKFFSYNHVNEKHAKIDWTIRITFIAVLVLGYIINMSRDPSDWLWYLEPWYLAFVFIIGSEGARAMLEWKYAENRNAYKLTLSQLLFIVILLVTIFTTNFFGII
ncbi:hypothetical protein Bcell_0956 [Evansella cellulosilytica DSM 2522]|uniref:DUF4181 domain-containing protein n=1 Tax=Evansella cellulosilytica (strain ATCC 21833 / DSM 2522 / FERM P-1141 / JCM 9156 / N-4) TaxID=649639 RepID=E6U1Y5_EVAC2|nr:DUF4181 domain-containing protein [Evansella cellulosilytica]ADU29229.1 hypothetical protein Bcell_0956 [Evansella cellulosilytica DSM 2522]